MYLSLSWRNVWRNKKRTIIAAASVFFAVLLAVLMRSGQHGSYAYMIHSSAKLFTGYLQVQGKGYWENRSLDKSIALSAAQIDSLAGIPHVTSVTPRLEAFALISQKANTKVSAVIGIDPAAEDSMTGLRSRLVAGKYLTRNSGGLLIGQGLAEVLGANLGDSLVLYGQGYHGQIAAARLPVTGIVKLPFPSMNNSMVYLSLSNAQNVFSAYGRITSLAIMVDNIRHLPEVENMIAAQLKNKYTIMTWDEMMPDLVQSIELDNASGIIMLIILYIVIAFGVFGTVMMMTSERIKEFGILVSVGMKKIKLIGVTTIETILVSFLGVVTGFLGSIPLIYYLHYHPIHFTGEAAKAYESLGIEPIMNFSIDPGIFLSQSIVVLIIALTTALYPLLFVSRLKPAKAIHH
ncbi:MAG: FtsX-like permease family protein [Calditrichota bacterium]